MKPVKATEFSKQIEKALIRAGKRARRLSEQTQTPFVVYQNGRVVNLNAAETQNGARKHATRLRPF